jgi:hypothetical protein
MYTTCPLQKEEQAEEDVQKRVSQSMQGAHLIPASMFCTAKSTSEAAAMPLQTDTSLWCSLTHPCATTLAALTVSACMMKAIAIHKGKGFVAGMSWRHSPIGLPQSCGLLHDLWSSC